MKKTAAQSAKLIETVALKVSAKITCYIFQERATMIANATSKQRIAGNIADGMITAARQNGLLAMTIHAWNANKSSKVIGIIIVVAIIVPLVVNTGMEITDGSILEKNAKKDAAAATCV